jgi:hypothetical protein
MVILKQKETVPLQRERHTSAARFAPAAHRPW